LSLDHLRQGINLRAYAQRDPLNEYKREAFDLFEEMLVNLRQQVTSVLSHVELRMEPPPPPPPGYAEMIFGEPIAAEQEMEFAEAGAPTAMPMAMAATGCRASGEGSGSARLGRPGPARRAMRPAPAARAKNSSTATAASKPPAGISGTVWNGRDADRAARSSRRFLLRADRRRAAALGPELRHGYSVAVRRQRACAVCRSSGTSCHSDHVSGRDGHCRDQRERDHDQPQLPRAHAAAMVCAGLRRRGSRLA